MSHHLPHARTLSTDENSDEKTLDETMTGQNKPENDGGFVKSPTDSEEDFPDGGLRAWLVVGGVSEELCPPTESTHTHFFR